MMAVGGPVYERWARLMGEPEWLEDPRYRTDQGRGDHGRQISERMSAWCAERTTAEALAELEEARVPAGRRCGVQAVGCAWADSQTM